MMVDLYGRQLYNLTKGDREGIKLDFRLRTQKRTVSQCLVSSRPRKRDCRILLPLLRGDRLRPVGRKGWLGHRGRGVSSFQTRLYCPFFWVRVTHCYCYDCNSTPDKKISSPIEMLLGKTKKTNYDEQWLFICKILQTLVVCLTKSHPFHLTEYRLIKEWEWVKVIIILVNSHLRTQFYGRKCKTGVANNDWDFGIWSINWRRRGVKE